MDVSFTNVLEGARQYFQGLPSASAAAGPYFQQQDQQPSSQQQINQQQQHTHQQHQFFQQTNDQYAGISTSTAGSSSHWHQQPSPSESARAPSRERTPIQRPPSHSSNSSRPPSHSSQYDASPSRYHSPYQSQSQDHLQAASNTQHTEFQFSRPQSFDTPSGNQHHISNSAYRQAPSPQLSRPSSSEQLTPTLQAYHWSSSKEQSYQTSQASGLPPPTSPQSQYYQSRSYAPLQSQSVTTKPSSSSSYLHSQTSQMGPHQYYKQASSQMSSLPPKNNHLENRSLDHNTHSNGQYQTATSREQTYRATHNLPPIAPLSKYRQNKSSKEPTKLTLPNTKVPSSNVFSSSLGQTVYSSSIPQSKSRSDMYPHTSSGNYGIYNSNQQNSQRLTHQISTVITQSYTNVIMTTSNTSAHTPNNQNHGASLPYQRSNLEVQNMPKGYSNQNFNYSKPKTVDIRMNNASVNVNNSVIKQRRESSPLDLSVKTVKTSADSTEGEALRNKYSQNKSQSVLSNHNYPTLDIKNSIEKGFTPRSQPSTATAPKVEFHPNFNLSSRNSAWNPQLRTTEETAIRSNTDFNKHLTAYQSESLKSIYPSTPMANNPPYYQKSNQKVNDVSASVQTYSYDSRGLSAPKRAGPVLDQPVVPIKAAKVENWRECIDLQIEEKFTSHLQAQQNQQAQSVQHRTQPVQPQPRSNDTVTPALVNGSYSQANLSSIYNYQKHLYVSAAQPIQSTYNKSNIPYQQSKYSQSYVPSPANYHYSRNYIPNAPTKHPQHLYINPLARSNSTASLTSLSKSNIPSGADKRVLSLLRNSIEIKEQKKIELQKSQDISINQRTDVQHPNTDVMAPLQPKPGIDRNNVSPFTPISVPDPNICKMPPKIIPSVEQTYNHDVRLINKATNEENTVIMQHHSNADYDGLAAFLAARIRTKGELKEVAQSQNLCSNAARDARIQAFLEDTIKSPNLQNMGSPSSVSSTGVIPPKLFKEKQPAFIPRKRLFSRNEDDSGKLDGPLRDKLGLRSSSETSVFDFPDSEDENEMPVLERQSLDAMRKDRRNSLKQSTTPLHISESEIITEMIHVVSRPPSPEDDIFGSICDKFLEQLKSKPAKLIKRTTESYADIKPEPKEEVALETIPTEQVKVKIEVEDDEFLVAQPEKIIKEENCSVEIAGKPNVEVENHETPVNKYPVKSDSDMSESEVKKGEALIAFHRHRVRRKIMLLSDKSEDEEDKDVLKTGKQDIQQDEQKENHSVIIKTESPSESEKSNKVEEIVKDNNSEGAENGKQEDPKSGTEETRKQPDLLSIRPAKKPPFGDGSDFYPGWEEGVYKYKKSLRMPPRLIHLTRPPTRLSTSLPDLDPCPQSPTTSISVDNELKESISDNKKSLKKFKSEPVDSDSESTSSFNIFCKKTNYDSEGSSSVKSLPNTKKENMSILDKLLEKCGGRAKRKHKRKDDHSPKVIPKSEKPIELLPTPTPGLAVTSESPEKSKGLTSPVINAKSAVFAFRKDTVNHFKDAFISSGNNILGVHDKFTTIVLSSRTRKETRAMKQRATIKEVFGADRPASAPPVACHNNVDPKEDTSSLEQFSKNLDEILANKEKVSERTETESSAHINLSKESNEVESLDVRVESAINTKIKKEIVDEEENEDEEDEKKLIDLIVKKDTDACSETRSLDGEDSGLSGKRKNRYGKMRRKFSSGFDYLRKKKKTKKEESDNGSVERKKKKGLPGKIPESIDDIQKEIKSWVLNKGIGESHLHRAARLGYVDITAYCLEKMDCPPSPKDNAGYTPLHEACSRGHLEIAKFLLKYGANVHESAKGGIRPLHEAIENGFVEIVRLLLSYGADPNLATYAGSTPLTLASDENTKTFLKDHLSDRTGEGGPPWPFYGPASCFDPEESGYDVFAEIPQSDTELELEDIDFDMSEALLPNLYILRGEPTTERWVLLQDLSHFLKIKSRDALLKQINSHVNSNKNVIRELKMSDFLEQARCCQFLNMGEKINTRASKIALVRYTDRVKELLGIETVVIAAR